MTPRATRIPSAGRWLGRGALRAAELLVTPPVLALALPLYLLPTPLSVRLARFYGAVFFLCWPPARRVAMVNLHRALGLDRRRARALAWRSTLELARSVAEGLRFARRFRGGGRAWEGAYRGEDPTLERAILDDPRPTVFVTAHLGSWEVLAMLLARRLGARGAALVRRLDNPFLDPFVRALRLQHRSQWIEKRGGATEALRRLRAGHAVGLLLDENAGRRGVFVDFFGRPASTQKTAAVLALQSGAQVAVGALLRVPGEPLPVLRLRRVPLPASGDPQRDLRALTQELTGVLEEWIRERPEQWRWLHWRWRERPDGTSERYGRRELRAAFGAARDVPSGRRGPTVDGRPERI
jgi:Kdo2-lipid IVA lauroyltransferase/acyltransferase